MLQRGEENLKRHIGRDAVVTVYSGMRKCRTRELGSSQCGIIARSSGFWQGVGRVKVALCKTRL